MSPRFVCVGCGAEVTAADLAAGSHPFACPRRAESPGVDHLLVRADTPAPPRSLPPLQPGHDSPFARYAPLLTAWAEARAAGMSEAELRERIHALDAAVAAVDGHGFRVSPFRSWPALARAAGVEAVWVKDETGQVSGSHKARHLMGVALHLDVAGVARARDAGGPPQAVPRLAIASCGNAALAAAVLAAADGRALDVFIPPDADPAVVRSLGELGADVHVCERAPGQRGDPTYHAFRRAVDDGALPFCCQGPDCGLTVEGGQTLAWEMAEVLHAHRFEIVEGHAGVAAPSSANADADALGGGPHAGRLDRVFIQVGGGALGSAVRRGLEDAVRFGWLPAMPALHYVQTEGCAPLPRAWDLVSRRAMELLGAPCPPEAQDDTWPARAARLARADAAEAVAHAMREARARRRSFMWPWEDTPHSLAHGILDDETYDWAALVEGMLRTGGYPVVVDEPTVAHAARFGGQQTDIPVTETGAAGLAGLLTLGQRGALRPTDRVAVVFTGVIREPILEAAGVRLA